MATLAEVQVKINADLAPLRSAFAKAKSMSSDLDKALNKSRKTMSATFKVDNSVRDRAADIAAYGKSLDDLRAKYNPLFAAQRDYRAQLSDIKRALDVGAISQTEYTAAIARTRTEFSKTFAAMRQSGDGLGQFNTAARGSDIEAYAKSLDDLKAKYNPVFAVQRRYANELHDIRRALKVGAITQEEYNAALRRTDDAFMAQITGMNAAKQAMLGSSQAVQLNNQQLMNMNYQITDLAVMTSSGQNPFIMIMQQGMQMADILTVAAGQTLTLRGAMGAVGQSVTRFFTNPLNLAVIGIASVAGAIPLIWQSINGTEAEEAKTTLEQFREFLDEISESAEEAGDEMRRVFEQLSANTYIETLRSAQEQQRALNETITESIGAVDAYRQARLQLFEDAATSGVALAEVDDTALRSIDTLLNRFRSGAMDVTELRESLIALDLPGNLSRPAQDAVASLLETTAAIKEAEAALESMGAAPLSQEMITFTNSMRDAQAAIEGIDSGNVRDQFQTLIDRVDDSDYSIESVLASLDELETSSLNLNGQIQEFIDLTRAAAMAADEIERVNIFSGMEQDPNAGSRISGAFRTIAEMEALDSLRNDGSSNRGGTSARDRAAEMAANQQFLADLEREVEILSMSYDQREAALQQFEREKSIREAIADLGETATPNQIAQLRELLNLQYELNDSIEDEQEARAEANRMMQQAGNIISNTLQGLVRGTKDLETAVLDAALAFAEMAYQAHMAKLFDTNSSAGGFGGSLLGALFGGLSGRAVGGPVSSNSAYKIGERGPELFIPHTSGMIVPNSALTNGGNYGNTTQQIDINVTANINGSVSRTEVEEITRTMAQGIRSEIPGAAVKAVSAYQYSGNRV